METKEKIKVTTIDELTPLIGKKGYCQRQRGRIVFNRKWQNSCDSQYLSTQTENHVLKGQ